MTARERELEAAVRELKNLALNMLAICQSIPRGNYDSTDGLLHEVSEGENKPQIGRLPKVQTINVPNVR